MSDEVDFTIRQGDLGPAFERVLRDERGAPLVIAADATVKFRMRPINDEVTVDAAAVVANGSKGRVRYVWQTGDTDTPGLFDAEFSVTDPGADAAFLVPRTVPTTGFFRIEILPAITPLHASGGLIALWLMNDAENITVFRDETLQNPLQVQGVPPALVEGHAGAGTALARDFVPDGTSGGAPFGYGLGAISSEQRAVFLGAAFSWAAWFRPINRPGDEDVYQTLLCLGASDADDALFYVVYNSGTHAFITGNAPSGTAQAGVLTDRAWTHLAVTFEPTSGPDGTFRLYQDGVKVGEETGWPAPTVDQPGAVWQLGASAPLAPDGGLSGQLQNVRVYDRLLSDAEVLALASE